MNYYTILLVFAGFLLFFYVSCLPNLFYIISKDDTDTHNSLIFPNNEKSAKSIDTLPPYTPRDSRVIEINDMPPSYENVIQNETSVQNNENNSVVVDIPPPVYSNNRDHISETERL